MRHRWLAGKPIDPLILSGFAHGYALTATQFGLGHVLGQAGISLSVWLPLVQRDYIISRLIGIAHAKCHRRLCAQ